MKFLVLVLAIAGALRADILRLRDGRMFTGSFLGATRTEIWFQNETPGDYLGAAAYPVEQVESLTFGPAARQSKTALETSAAEVRRTNIRGTFMISSPDVRANLPSGETPRNR